MMYQEAASQADEHDERPTADVKRRGQNRPMKPAKTPNGAAPSQQAPAARARWRIAASEGKSADGLRVHIVAVSRADHLPGEQESARRQPTAPATNAARGVAVLVTAANHQSIEKNETAVCQQESRATRQRLDRAIERSRQRKKTRRPDDILRHRRDDRRKSVQSDDWEQQDHERRQAAGQSRQRRKVASVKRIMGRRIAQVSSEATDESGVSHSGDADAQSAKPNDRCPTKHRPEFRVVAIEQHNDGHQQRHEKSLGYKTAASECADPEPEADQGHDPRKTVVLVSRLAKMDTAAASGSR
jgi:hypothetical protein